MGASAARLTPYARCLAVIEGRRPDRVPAYTPTIACDVASEILGREVKVNIEVHGEKKEPNAGKAGPPKKTRSKTDKLKETVLQDPDVQTILDIFQGTVEDVEKP